MTRNLRGAWVWSSVIVLAAAASHALAGQQQSERIDLQDGSARPEATADAARVAPANAAAAQDGTIPAAPPPSPAPASGTAKADASPIGPLEDVVAVDLAVPSSPAMAVIGMTGTEIQRPAFPRDLVTSLLRGVDKDGKTKNALAIDVAPIALFFPQTIIGGQIYEHDYWMQLRARTTLSLAASQVENGNGASQLAAGLRFGLFDKADPGLYWNKMSKCVTDRIEQIPLPTGRTTEDTPAMAEAITRINKECAVEQQVTDLWAKPALYVGYAQGWYSDSGSVKDATSSAKALWASYSIGLNPRTQTEVRTGTPAGTPRVLLQLYLARKLDDRVKNPSGADNFVREDRSEVITRVRFGKARWHSFVDAGVSRVRTAGVASENVRRLGFGVEYQLRDDLWLVLGSVRETGFAAGGRNLISTGLRFGQVPKAVYGLPGAHGE